MRRVLYALAVWIIVSVLLYVLARLLDAIGLDVTVKIADFLDATNVVIGFLAGLWYYFFGYPDRTGHVL